MAWYDCYFIDWSWFIISLTNIDILHNFTTLGPVLLTMELVHFSTRGSSCAAKSSFSFVQLSDFCRLICLDKHCNCNELLQ